MNKAAIALVQRNHSNKKEHHFRKTSACQLFLWRVIQQIQSHRTPTAEHNYHEAILRETDILLFSVPAYNYGYVEQERLQPYSFSDSARLGFKTRFFRDENLESKFSNGLIVEYGNNADELNIYGGYRNPTIEDYKQGRF